MDAATQAAPPRAAMEADKPESLGLPGYFAQILPEPPRICGLALKPLSIGRYRRMKRQNIAFVAEIPIEKPPEQLAGDLLQAVLICSMTCADYDAFLADPDAAREVNKWAQQVGFLPERYYNWGIIGRWFIKYVVGPEVTQMRNERAAAYIIEQMRLFQEYIVAGQSAPDYWDESESGRASAAHWSHNIECHLRNNQGWTKQEIDEEPLTKALWDYFKSMESAGLVRLMSPEEAARIKTPLTPEQVEESRVALEKLWRYKFGDAPMPTDDQAAAGTFMSPEPIPH